MKKLLGLRNLCTTSQDWYYLLFYDIDGEPNCNIEDVASICNVSYICYKTKHGYHFVSFTPLTILEYAEAFTFLKRMFGGYYSGQTIRLSLKAGERQEVVHLDTSKYYTIPNLYNIYAKRFGLPRKDLRRDAIGRFAPIYHLVFEKYWTDKE